MSDVRIDHRVASELMERDLVTVADDFVDKLESVKPYIISQADRAVEAGPPVQTPLQLLAFKQYTMCINCMLCYSACPQYALSPEFVGPAALDVVRCHHERWDGTGYPQGLMGDEIPLSARIFALVDVYDALCSERPYKQAWREDAARAMLLKGAGRHFDPQLARRFLNFLRDRGD